MVDALSKALTPMKTGIVQCSPTYQRIQNLEPIYFSVMVNFNNKVVWITGASSGIGEALAYAFAKQGSKLVLSARREEELQRVKKATKLPVQQVFILPMDMTKSEEFPEKVATAINYFGQIDIVVHNVGISQRSLVKDTPLLVDRMLMEVNFFGVVALTR
jgi:short-subunit dehydrogenase